MSLHRRSKRQFDHHLQAAARASEIDESEILGQGADVNAQGGYYGNALQAAAWQKSTFTVKLLLQAGADVNAQGGQWGNALQAASCSSSVEVVEILLEAGADVNAQGGHLGNALQAASYARSEEIVRVLLIAGADVNVRGGYYGTALQAAAYRRSTEITKLLVEAGADINAQEGYYGNALQAAAYSSNTETIRFLLENGADVYAQGGHFGNALQATSYLCSAETVKLLLKAGADVNAQGGQYGSALHAAINRKSTATVKLLLEHGADVNAPGFKYNNALQATVSTHSLELLQLLLCLAFSNVAVGQFEWLKELHNSRHSYLEIAELFAEQAQESPWISFRLPTHERCSMSVNMHQKGCIHLCHQRQPSASSDPPSDQASDVRSLASIEDVVAEFCGLAGIRPISDQGYQRIGTAVLGREPLRFAAVTYEKQGKYDKSEFDSLIACVSEALSGIVAAVGWLQANQLCCERLVVLAHRPQPDIVGAFDIPLCLIKQFNIAIEQDLLCSGTRKLSAFTFCIEILQRIYGNAHDEFWLTALHTDTDPAHELTELHLCAIATQSLSIATLSYVNGHCGLLSPFFLESSLAQVMFFGTEKIGNLDTISTIPNVQLVELSCLGSMLQGPVRVFHSSKCSDPDSKYHLYTSPEDLIDLWGPARLVLPNNEGISHPREVLAIEIRGGLIRSAPSRPGIFHWSNDLQRLEADMSGFSLQDKILVGATMFSCTVNKDCPMDSGESLRNCGSFLDILGTRPACWVEIERAYGLQVGGPYALLQISSTRSRRQGLSIKDFYLDSSPTPLQRTVDLSFLDQFWGLQVSLCTGVAERVRIREMLAHVMTRYVESRSFPLWDELVNKHQVLDHLQSADFRDWAMKLPHEVRTAFDEAAYYTLKVLQPTGFSAERSEFVIACPLIHDPFRCFRIESKGGNLWTRALADREDCATFAFITPRCLETDSHLCKRARYIHWDQSVPSLYTAVCQHGVKSIAFSKSIAWASAHATEFLIGQDGDQLRARFEKFAPEGYTRLTIRRSIIPRMYEKRALAKWPLRKLKRIRERFEPDPYETKVLMLSPS